MPLWFLGISATASTVFILIMRWLVRRQAIICNCLSPVGRHAVITGANSGIGLATAFELAKRNWKLTLGCRNLDSAFKVKEEIANLTGNHDISVRLLDLENPRTIEEFVRFLPLPVHILINNAGVYPKTLRSSKYFQDINVTLATNYVGHFYLTSLLLPYFKKSYHETSVYPRVIVVSSSLSKKGTFTTEDLFQPYTTTSDLNSSKAYSDSKLACNLFSRELYRRYGSGDSKILDVYCLFTGGMVNTNLFRNTLAVYSPITQRFIRGLMQLLLKSPSEGCQTVVHCAVSDQVPIKHNEASFISAETSGSGMLYNNCIPIDWPDNSLNSYLACQLWDYTTNFLKLSVNNK
ncbi:unnamed protein product [Schistosoma turkestanicum]|nr:unnamed protein product [Schistosoma turkestanicum]